MFGAEKLTDCFHGSTAVVVIVGFRVAVILHITVLVRVPSEGSKAEQTYEAAAAIDVRSTHHRVDGFFLVSGCDSRRVVHMVAEARIEPHAVYRSATDRDFVLGRIHELVARAQVVVLRRLVVDVRNDAVQLGAERVVCRDVRDTACLEHTHVLRRAVRAACDVVERTIVLFVYSTCAQTSEKPASRLLRSAAHRPEPAWEVGRTHIVRGWCCEQRRTGCPPRQGYRRGLRQRQARPGRRVRASLR